MRALALILLYPVVFLLVSVPPVVAWITVSVCTGPPDAICPPVTSRQVLTWDVFSIWMPPLILAIFLIGVIFRLQRAAPVE